jgi:hypothetical protein
VRQPSWPVLCRILAAMGLQPRLVAEECDLGHHEATADVRTVGDLWWHPGRNARRATGTEDLAEIMRPSKLDCDASLRAVGPVCELLAGVPFVFVGRGALKLYGLGCSAPDVLAGPLRELARDLEWDASYSTNTRSSVSCSDTRLPSGS